MELHDWLMFFHILGAIVWVGAVILMNAMMARASRAPDRTAVLRLAGELEWGRSPAHRSIGPGSHRPGNLARPRRGGPGLLSAVDLALPRPRGRLDGSKRHLLRA